MLALFAEALVDALNMVKLSLGTRMSDPRHAGELRSRYTHLSNVAGELLPLSTHIHVFGHSVYFALISTQIYWMFKYICVC